MPPRSLSPPHSPVAAHTRSHPREPDSSTGHLFRLREVAGGDGVVRVHVPFSTISPKSKKASVPLISSPSLPLMLKRNSKRLKIDGPETPIQDLVKMAFKVFNAREETAEAARQARLQQKVRLQTQALVAALRPVCGGLQSSAACGTHPKAVPPGACFKCGKDGHWPCQCPNPRPPTKPCPQCEQPGHWKSDCLGFPRPSVPPHGGADEGQHPVFELLCLAEDRRGLGSGTPVTLAEPRVMLQVAGMPPSLHHTLPTEARRLLTRYCQNVPNGFTCCHGPPCQGPC
ncbi:uncharacterized protein LOC107499816 [Rousettus aegyptiacus]|uniref:uncharacterized protein LOC107499816 n=1 Tax=Rousettus aegyptiacus TaxID=9407 RepID=UPI00168D28D3|nr:uncharacterized protein LOC107499816 [Rousettus aegyptiacus]